MIAPTSSTRIFDLEQPRTVDMPMHPAHKPGYSYALHRRHADSYGSDGPRSGASGLIVCKEHAGTHIDALCHQAEHMFLCGGVAVDARVESASGFSQHGVETIAPIVGRGILLDIAGFKNQTSLDAGYAISRTDVIGCAHAQHTKIAPGDVVLVHTGNDQYWHDESRYLAGPGMHGDASRWIAEQKPVAVGADNMAWDVIGLVDDDLGCTLPGHIIMLARNGIYILENLYLGALARARHYAFQFVCAPLKFVGATGSPVRPIAIVTDEQAA